jgi:hypothetical protein
MARRRDRDESQQGHQAADREDGAPPALPLHGLRLVESFRQGR